MPLPVSTIPSANADTLLYTTPATTAASVTVSICNRGSQPVTFGVAITGGAAAPTNAEWRFFNCPLQPGQSMMSAPYALLAAQRVYVRASAADVAFALDGVEEPVIEMDA
jgi:hypothetical protein